MSTTDDRLDRWTAGSMSKCTTCGAVCQYDPSNQCDACEWQAFEAEWSGLTEEQRWTELAEAVGGTRADAEALVHRVTVAVETMLAQCEAGLPIQVPDKVGEA